MLSKTRICSKANTIKSITVPYTPNVMSFFFSLPLVPNPSPKPHICEQPTSRAYSSSPNLHSHLLDYAQFMSHKVLVGDDKTTCIPNYDTQKLQNGQCMCHILPNTSFFSCEKSVPSISLACPRHIHAVSKHHSLNQSICQSSNSWREWNSQANSIAKDKHLHHSLPELPKHCYIGLYFNG